MGANCAPAKIQRIEGAEDERLPGHGIARRTAAAAAARMPTTQDATKNARSRIERMDVIGVVRALPFSVGGPMAATGAWAVRPVA